jgi:outer membrane PBP1 activator LpoA protein
LNLIDKKTIVSKRMGKPSTYLSKKWPGKKTFPLKMVKGVLNWPEGPASPPPAGGFPKRLKQHPSFQFMSTSKVVTLLVGSGKEAFEMVQRTFCGC